MISKSIGKILKKNTRTKIWWMKLGLALILSNVFFFILFSSSEAETSAAVETTGMVEVSLEAELLTPFQKGKRILLINRPRRGQIEGVLIVMSDEGTVTVGVKEEKASLLFEVGGWQVLPFIPNLHLTTSKGGNHEIRY